MIITVLTPTFNRVDKLHRVYESLIKQDNHNFRWIIVDDGSTDETKLLVNSWINENEIEIQYLYKNNGGKISAIKFGLNYVKSELVLIADSDDRFYPETIAFFTEKYYEFSMQLDNELLAGITCLCANPETKEVIGDIFPYSPMISNVLEIDYKYNVKGEKWGVLNTSILRNYLNGMNLDNVKFLSENYIWYDIALKYKTVFINKVLRLYYQDTKNSLSAPFNIERHPEGMFLTSKKIIICSKNYLLINPKKVVIQYLQLIYASIRSKKTINVLLESLDSFQILLVFLLFPLAFIISLYKYFKYKLKVDN